MKGIVYREDSFEAVTTREGIGEYNSWFKGNFWFLLERSLNKYDLPKTNNRRNRVQAKIGIILPPLTNDMLDFLLLEALKEYKKKLLTQCEHSGFSRTSSEDIFIKNLKQIIKETHKSSLTPIKTDLCLFDSKLAIGNIVPDAVVFGLKYGKGVRPIVFEIDGASHSKKERKDSLRDSVLRLIKVQTIRLSNEMAQNKDFLKNLINKMRATRSGPTDKQILKQQRLLKIKTISCLLTLEKIDQVIKNRFNVDLHLSKELTEYIHLKDCPRRIYAEANKSPKIKAHYGIKSYRGTFND